MDNKVDKSNDEEVKFNSFFKECMELLISHNLVLRIK